jgi:hypothetical protein
MNVGEIDPLLSRAREHLAMAIRLRSTASKLTTTLGKARLTQLAALYEQLSLYFLEESCLGPTDRHDGHAQPDSGHIDRSNTSQPH